MRAITRRASSSIVTRSVEPTLRISPETSRASIRPASARIVSWTWQKQRVCVPSPWISIARPATAADDDAVEPSLLVVSERQELVERLRLGVRPAPCGRRSIHPLAVLGERFGLAPVAVDLRRGCDEHALAEPVAVIEHGLGALDVRHERVDGLFDDEPHSDRRREVEHDVAAVHELVDDRRLEHGVHYEVEVAALAQMRDVALRAGREIVEDEDLPALFEKELREMRADEARAAGDQGALLRSAHRAIVVAVSRGRCKQRSRAVRGNPGSRRRIPWATCVGRLFAGLRPGLPWSR